MSTEDFQSAFNIVKGIGSGPPEHGHGQVRRLRQEGQRTSSTPPSSASLGYGALRRAYKASCPSSVGQIKTRRGGQPVLEGDRTRQDVGRRRQAPPASAAMRRASCVIPGPAAGRRDRPSSDAPRRPSRRSQPPGARSPASSDHVLLRARCCWTRCRRSCWRRELRGGADLRSRLAACGRNGCLLHGNLAPAARTTSSVGPQQRLEILFESGAGWYTLKSNLGIFSVLFVGIGMALGLLLAILLDQKIRAAKACCAPIYLYPMALGASSSPAPPGSGSSTGLGLEHLMPVGFENFPLRLAGRSGHGDLHRRHRRRLAGSAS